MTLEGLALSRSTLDRAGHRRDDALVPRLLADSDTVVVALLDSRAAVSDGPDGPHVVRFGAPELSRGPADGESAVELLFLGEDVQGRAHVAAIRAAEPSPVPLPAGARWAGLREVGSLLDDTDAGILTTAVALAGWHAGHPRCSRCGEPTVVVQAGWARRCPACGAEHYPRTDPAVIMAVVDADDRILLGRQSVWPERRYSTLAGFVEPGESLEAAVRREVREESGVIIGEVVYRGSQPWPFPSSLMLGFRATAASTAIQVDGVELSDVRWWDRAAFSADIADGTLLLPPPVSIARRLIEEWYGGRIDAQEAWR